VFRRSPDIDDPQAVVMGKVPDVRRGRPVGYVTSAAYGYAINMGIAYVWLPAELATPRHDRAHRLLRPERRGGCRGTPVRPDRDLTSVAKRTGPT
jgi:glycine cleavage system aminomethyltransferase T